MSTRVPLVLVNGHLAELPAGDTLSTGTTTVSAVASEALSAGDMVDLFLSGGVLKVQKANATDTTKPADGYVLTSYSLGATASVNVAEGSIITGLSGLTIGSDYYLSTSGGGITATAPSGAGNLAQRVGKGLSATSLLFEFQPGSAVGGSSTAAGVSPLFSFTTDRPSSAAGSDLYAGLVPANTLAANGDRVRAKFFADFAANADSRFTDIVFAGTNIYSDELTDNNANYWFEVEIVRVNSTVVNTSVRAFTAAGTSTVQYSSVPSLSLSATDYVLTLNVTSDADADLIAKGAYGEYVAAAPLTAPSSLANIWAYFESDSFNALSNGATIATSWPDKSGNGRNATVSGSPTFQTNQLNGEGIVRLPGSAYFQLPSMSGLTAVAEIAVMKVTDVTTNGGDTFGTSGSSSHYPNTDTHIYDDFGSNARKTISASAITILNTWHVRYRYSAAGDWALYQNGIQAFQTGTNTVAPSSSPRIGYNGAFNMKEDLAALYYFAAKPTAASLYHILSRIDRKYGV